MSKKVKDFGIEKTLKNLGIKEENKGTSTGGKYFASGKVIESISPVDGKLIAKVKTSGESDYDKVIETAQKAFQEFRLIPAPKRGEMVRQLGLKLREYKDDLGKLVSYEMGKSLQEGLGEVQEMIDICDFAVGLSRQLQGYTMHSERPGHRMYEQYHPLGVVGIITAFNFPVAVWSWNTALAWICGNVTIWKPSEKTPLCAIACQNIMMEVLKENNLPEGVSSVLVSDHEIGQKLVDDKRVALVSFTGSTRVGRMVSSKVAERFGKSILELGGNNAIIITKEADIDMSIIGAVFGAVGTAGQRCTSTRRLIIHESVYNEVKTRLTKAYGQLKIGNPLDENNHVGPLIDTDAVNQYEEAIKKCKKEGGKFVVEGGVLTGKDYESGCYVKPCVAEVKNSYEIVQHETFAPILYLIKYKTLEEAIAIQNDVPQGLSSAIMTQNLREAELFLSHAGSDCGIANVNIGTSGAEIGGAFGGEKETGGGRESGSDAWKYYMRRQTNTINYTAQLPLAQGIKFDL
ncbi:aldehyde dehydrogenase (NAD+) [Chryseobacterium bernardetii]|jgi:aldehyde dehydrogenase (NAD+)|uniref:aldehyde dehydrogenase (NAD(+)) n=3 Tax=Chryseobacterium TaxID=59732 RepID=A0A543EIB5_9FLAO|nr:MULTISPECIES: aldehyde dehydrogenase family protein [Chryseobacterium]MDR6369767.1 aldehyde dehydrogenase (NAD+) [Chryseobacterium vietnamense]MDR6440990.1 aldehyde dehydrogenase (NAD+) [Chryseobacterium bernardetii]MDR6457794.1 aldehyde dehydrogenase (NAD+) [Chryseobacterium vietnamense]MDR6486503.1 aldehyde dehydrogenase (NAD+) [Chryseobacterium vietnamense]TQM21330.1 aldehyde dehydrogenase (NAD+) [Chryseobacterium aquifrigidense]